MFTNRFILFLFIFCILFYNQELLASKKKQVSVSFTKLNEQDLDLNVKYTKYIFKNGRYSHKIHSVTVDLRDSTLKPEILLSLNTIGELDKLINTVNVFQNENEKKVLAAINASFWRAYSLLPIGPTIINGELVEMITYKKWSSAFFDKNNHLYIDNFFVSGEIKLPSKKSFKINSVNRRLDSIGLVLYNRHYGNSLPFIKEKKVNEEFKKILSESTIFNDSTEFDIDVEELRKEILSQKILSNLEFRLNKILVEYIEPPAVNKPIKCRVVNIVNGSVNMPENGCIISLGDDFPLELLPIKNDTIEIHFETNVHKKIVFINGISGTPRLVRNGVAKHEAYQEGSKGRRFIYRMLPRTAIGTDKNREKLFLVCIEPGTGRYNFGANLSQLSIIMKRLGAYNAMNLDGGGSSVMVINNGEINKVSSLEGRRISVGLAISKFLKRIN